MHSHVLIRMMNDGESILTQRRVVKNHEKRTMTIKFVLPFPLARCLVLPQLEHTCVHDVHSADTDTIQQQQHKT